MKAQQDLYKEHGYSPVSGCLPLLIQMPFLYALLFSFRTLLTESKNHAVILEAINKPIYPFLPHLTAIPNASFLWVNLGSSRSVAYSALRGCSLHLDSAAHGDAGPQEAGSRYTYRSDCSGDPDDHVYHAGHHVRYRPRFPGRIGALLDHRRDVCFSTTVFPGWLGLALPRY